MAASNDADPVRDEEKSWDGSGPLDWFARNGVAANLLMVVILALGFHALAARVPLEVFPEFERDVVTVVASYRGATPSEVEQAAVIRIEEAVADLDGIESIESSAYEGAGRVVIEVERGRARELLEDIKNRVDGISSFPDEVERPSYSVATFRREVISVVVAGDLPERELRILGEQVRDDLTALPEVSLAELTGVRPYEIAIEVSEATLARHGLTFDQIVEAVRRSSTDLPAGSIRTVGGEILLRTTGQAYRQEDFARIGVMTRADGVRLTLGEIATIRDGFEEEPRNAAFNGKPAVLIEVYRTGQQSALDIGQAVRDYVADSVGRMPEGVELGYWRDRSRIVKLRLETLLKSAWQGGLLVFLCLALFLRLSVALWVCVGIPISFMGAIALMPELGVTLNILSLFSFILVLGIVVDDAIVTGENIYTRMRRGEAGLTAAIRGTREVAVPVTFGLLTTVVAFMPLLFMEGRRGPIFAQIPMIVVPVLLFSWVESKLILPAHMSHIRLGRESGGGVLERIQRATANGLERFIERWHQPFLDRVLIHRYLTLALFLGLSFVVTAYVTSGRFGFTFFPRVQSETARATLIMENGTAEEITAAHVRRITREAENLQRRYTDPDTGESVIRNILLSVGWKAGGGRPGVGGGEAELGQVTFELVPPEERTLPVTTNEIVDAWREAIGPIPGARELNYKAEIGHGGSPIDVQLTGHDFARLKEVAAAVRQRLEQYPGVFDIQDSFEAGMPEIRLAIRPEAELLGLSTTDLGRQVRNAFFGAEAQRIQRGRDDVRVMVRYPAEERRTLMGLEAMRIRTADGAEAPIGAVTDIDLGTGFASIRRVDRQRAVDIEADIRKGEVDINQISRDLEVFLDDLLPDYPGVRYSFEGEMREQQESFHSLLFGMLFLFFGIYALLAIPLRSYAQPILVILLIPLSVIGAFLGHMLLGVNLSLMSLMGSLALGGVVVNDSLVLVDWINRRRAEGIEVMEAVRMAGAARFRPILLTSLTTFAGLAPLIWEKSTQAQFLIPMAISLGFGILYATLLSLLLIPAGYLILEDIRGLFGGGERADPGLESQQP